MIRYTVGNGQHVFLWHDNWHPKGSLLFANGPRLVITSGLHIKDKLSAVIVGLEWHWPHARSDDFLKLWSLLCGVISPQDSDDVAQWVPSVTQVFHTGATWNWLRQMNQFVDWYHLVWFKSAVLKHCFISWFAFLNRLSTKVRQHKHDSSISPNCSFLWTRGG